MLTARIHKSSRPVLKSYISSIFGWCGGVGTTHAAATAKCVKCLLRPKTSFQLYLCCARAALWTSSSQRMPLILTNWANTSTNFNRSCATIGAYIRLVVGSCDAFSKDRRTQKNVGNIMLRPNTCVYFLKTYVEDLCIYSFYIIYTWVYIYISIAYVWYASRWDLNNSFALNSPLFCVRI